MTSLRITAWLFWPLKHIITENDPQRGDDSLSFPFLYPPVWNLSVMAGALAVILDQEDEVHIL